MEILSLWLVWAMIIVLAIKTSIELSLAGNIFIWAMLALFTVSIGVLTYWEKKE